MSCNQAEHLFKKVIQDLIIIKHKHSEETLMRVPEGFVGISTIKMQMLRSRSLMLQLISCQCKFRDLCNIDKRVSLRKLSNVNRNSSECHRSEITLQICIVWLNKIRRGSNHKKNRQLNVTIFALRVYVKHFKSFALRYICIFWDLKKGIIQFNCSFVI